eukprot:gene3962-4932_t
MKHDGKDERIKRFSIDSVQSILSDLASTRKMASHVQKDLKQQIRLTQKEQIDAEKRRLEVDKLAQELFQNNSESIQWSQGAKGVEESKEHEELRRQKHEMRKEKRMAKLAKAVNKSSVFLVNPEQMHDTHLPQRHVVNVTLLKEQALQRRQMHFRSTLRAPSFLAAASDSAQALGIHASHLGQGNHREAALHERQAVRILEAEELKVALEEAAALDDNLTCKCVAAYSGPLCHEPKPLPEGLTAEFDGDIIFNRGHIRRLSAPFEISYKCNPKASGGTHSFNLPITKELINALPPVDPFLGRRYKKCAVVGNSGLLRLYRFGKEIEDHDMVLRFNVAPAQGFEEFVGARTDWRLMNTQHIGKHEKDEPGIQQMQSRVGVHLYLKFRRKNPSERVFAFDPEFSRYVSANVRTLPTGGFFGVLLAMQRCEQVNVYGFHFRRGGQATHFCEPHLRHPPFVARSWKGYGVGHHYFNSEKPLKGAVAIHDYDLEYEQIKRLAGAMLVNIREPCVAGCMAETGIPEKVAAGGMCICDYPFPLAKPGHCRLKGSFECFIRCTGPTAAADCPGGVSLRPPKDPRHLSGPLDSNMTCTPEQTRMAASLGECPELVAQSLESDEQ